MEHGNEEDDRPTRSDGIERRILVTVGLAAMSAIVSIGIGGVAVLDSVVLWPVAGLALVAGVVVGGSGVAAITLGYLVAAFGLGTLDASAGVAAGSLLLFGYVSAYLWRREIVLPAVDVRIRTDASQFLVTILVGSVAGASAMAWGGEITRQAPFFVGLRHTVSYVLTGLVIGVPLWYGVRRTRIAIRDASTSHDVSERDPPLRSPQATVGWMLVTVISTVWLLVGTLGSVGYHSFETVLTRFPYTFHRRDLDELLVVHNDALFGVGGSRAQAVFGGVMASLLLWAFLDDATGRSNARGGGET